VCFVVKNFHAHHADLLKLLRPGQRRQGKRAGRRKAETIASTNSASSTPSAA
jgi:hypothetical protein